MKYGAGFPLKALPDAAAIRDYAVALEAAGFDFTSTAGHILGQPAGAHPDRAAPQYVGPFNDPFVTFSFLAGVTQRIRFMTAILILPALPTALDAAFFSKRPGPCQHIVGSVPERIYKSMKGL